jgi:hypothetical protein
MKPIKTKASGERAKPVALLSAVSLVDVRGGASEFTQVVAPSYQKPV